MRVITEGAVTITVAVWLISTPFAVAETVLVPASLEDSVPVAMPSAPVGSGCVRMFDVPVAVSWTDAPFTGLPKPSFTVTVIVATPPWLVITGGDAVTVDWEADTPDPRPWQAYDPVSVRVRPGMGTNRQA